MCVQVKPEHEICIVCSVTTSSSFSAARDTDHV